MEKIKKLFLAFVSLFGVGLLNVEAKDVDTTYCEVVVNGVSLGEEKNGITALEENSVITNGNVIYDTDAKTLTLSGVTFSLNEDASALIEVNNCSDFNIVLEGASILSDGYENIIINAKNSNIFVKGTGSLEGTSSSNAIIVSDGSLTVEEVTLNLTSKGFLAYNVAVDKDILVKGAILNLKGGWSALSGENITIDNSVVSLLGNLSSFDYTGTLEFKNLDNKVMYAWSGSNDKEILIKDVKTDIVYTDPQGGEYTAFQLYDELGVGYFKTVATYSISVDSSNASVLVTDETGIMSGETRDISIKADKGYKLTSILVNGDEVIQKLNDGKLTLTIDNDTLVIVKTRALEKEIETPTISTSDVVKVVTVGVKEDSELEEVFNKALDKDNIDVTGFDSKVVVTIQNQEEDVVSKNALEGINSLVKENGNIKVASYFDITINVKNTELDEIIAVLSELDKKITFNVLLPEDISKVQDGYTRTYYIVRYHDGKAEILDATIDGNVLTFASDKFSTYAIAYTDTLNTPIENPSTGDNILVYVVTSVIAVLGIAGTLIFTSKKKDN